MGYLVVGEGSCLDLPLSMRHWFAWLPSDR